MTHPAHSSDAASGKEPPPFRPCSRLTSEQCATDTRMAQASFLVFMQNVDRCAKFLIGNIFSIYYQHYSTLTSQDSYSSVAIGRGAMRFQGLVFALLCTSSLSFLLPPMWYARRPPLLATTTSSEKKGGAQRTSGSKSAVSREGNARSSSRRRKQSPRRGTTAKMASSMRWRLFNVEVMTTVSCSCYCCNL